MLNRIYQSGAGDAALWAAGKTVPGGCVDIEAISDVALVNAFTIPPVMSTRDTVISTRAPTAACITKPRTIPSEHRTTQNTELTSNNFSVSSIDINTVTLL